MDPRLKLERNRRTGIGRKTLAARAGWVVWVLTIQMFPTVHRAVHVVGVGCWVVPGWGVTQVVVLGGITAIVACIILRGVGGHRRSWGRSRSRTTSHADSCITAGSSVIQRIVAMAVSATVVATVTGVRVLLLGGRSVFDNFGVEREVGGVSQETFSIAPAHVRGHDNDHKDQADQST